MDIIDQNNLYLKISIVIPTHNRLDKLRKVLSSITEQTILPLEVIIIDNSSNPLISTLIKRLVDCNSGVSVKYKLIIGKNNSKSYHARNLGIKYAKGSVIAFIDDDCIIDRNWCFQIATFFSNKSRHAVIGKSINYYKNNIFSITDDFKTRRLIDYNTYSKDKLLYSYYLDTKNFAIRKKIIEKYNLYFDENFYSGGDIDLGLRLHSLGIPIIFNPKMIVYHLGLNSFNQLIRKEFIKGENRFFLEHKWKLNDKKNRISYLLKLINDIRSDKIIQNKPINIKYLIFILMVISVGTYLVGKKLQAIKNNMATWNKKNVK